MLRPYRSNMKAICSEGIQDNVRPEEINKKTEHNDRASKNSNTVSPDCVRPDTWNEKLHLYSARWRWDSVKIIVCPLTFLQILLVIYVISDYEPDTYFSSTLLLQIEGLFSAMCVYAWFPSGLCIQGSSDRCSLVNQGVSAIYPLSVILQLLFFCRWEVNLQQGSLRRMWNQNRIM